MTVAFKTRFTSNLLAPIMALAVNVVCMSAIAQTPTYKLGRTPTEEEIRAWNIAIGPEGKELPPGRGTAKDGAKIYAEKCAKCHGPTGAEGPLAPQLVGGMGTLNTSHPEKTVGSYWPYATTIWDTINRSMPWKAGGSLNADEVYALTAYLLFRNGIIRENDVMDAKSLPKVRMPNRNGFMPEHPEWKGPSSRTP